MDVHIFDASISVRGKLSDNFASTFMKMVNGLFATIWTC